MCCTRINVYAQVSYREWSHNNNKNNLREGRKNDMRQTNLKLDIDTKDFGELMNNAKEIHWTLDTLNLTLEDWVMHETAKGYHIEILIKEPLEPLAIVCLQALCGSDLRRETFNMARVLKLSDAPTFWQSRWNVLYSEKLQPEEKKK